MKSIIAKLVSTRKLPKPCPHCPQSILLKPIGDAIGDALIHLIHLSQLKQAYPHLKTGVIVTERNRVLFEHSPYVDSLIQDSAIHYIQQRNQWQIYLDFQPNYTTRSILLDAILHPEIVINFGKKIKKHYHLDSVRNYDYSVNVPQHAHCKDYLAYSPLKENLPPAINQEFIKIPDAIQQKANQGWHFPHKIKLLLNPQGSGRYIPASELALLLNELPLEDLEILLVNTNNSEMYLTELKQCGLNNIRLAEKTTLLSYFALMRSADLVIAVDGGGVHVACMYGKSLLAFYANNPYNLAKWLPVPAENQKFFTVIAKDYSDNNGTKGFDLKPAVLWLTQQIAQLSEK